MINKFLYIYLDNNKENSINVTAQLSQNMNLQTHKIQCMKASFDDIFYNEIEPMEQDEEIYSKIYIYISLFHYLFILN